MKYGMVGKKLEAKTRKSVNENVKKANWLLFLVYMCAHNFSLSLSLSFGSFTSFRNIVYYIVSIFAGPVVFIRFG